MEADALNKREGRWSLVLKNKVFLPQHCPDQYLQIINNVLNWSLTLGNIRIHSENRTKNVGNLQLYRTGEKYSFSFSFPLWFITGY